MLHVLYMLHATIKYGETKQHIVGYISFENGENGGKFNNGTAKTTS